MNAEVRPIRTAAESGLIEAFEAVRAALPGGETAAGLRDAAFRAFAAKGLPNRRVEEWKYTDLRALMREARPLVVTLSDADVAAARDLLPFADADVLRIVFVNGRLAPALSQLDDAPEGVRIVLLADALAADAQHALMLEGAPADNAAVALNTAFASDGLMIAVHEGVTVEKPIHVASVQTGGAHAAYGRVLVSVGKGASITLVESHTGDPEGHQTNTLIGLDLADEARVTHVKLQDEGLGTLHLGTLAARMGARADLASVSVSSGAAVARQQVFLAFKGEKAVANINGAGFAGGRRHIDSTLVIHHEAPGCASRELFKTALDGQARSVFQGKIVVQPHAQKTDGKMMAKALLLSNDAEADAKPELEIFADDVVCGHGATVGAIDDELLFYLMSRGVPKPEAEALLVRAFVGEVIESVANDELREALTTRVERWLRERD